MHHVGMAAGSRPGDASSVGGRREPAACGGSDALFSRDRSRYQRHGSDALLLRDALLMHHQLSVGGNQRRAAGVMHYFRGTEVLMHHVGMAAGGYHWRARKLQVGGGPGDALVSRDRSHASAASGN